MKTISGTFSSEDSLNKGTIKFDILDGPDNPSTNNQIVKILLIFNRTENSGSWKSFDGKFIADNIICGSVGGKKYKIFFQEYLFGKEIVGYFYHIDELSKYGKYEYRILDKGKLNLSVQ